MVLIGVLLAVIEVVIEVVVEIVMQVVAELLVELGVRGFGKLSERRSNPIVAGIGYALLGAGLGGASVWLWPQALMSDELRVVQLVLGPLLAGAMMAGIGALMRRRGKQAIRLESFLYGWLLAFSLSLVRFLAAG